MNPLRLPALLFMLFISAPATAAAEPPVRHIDWLMTEEPAEPNAQGRLQLSPTEQLLAYIARQWPQVEHRIVSANIKRSMQLLQAGQPVCHAALVRTPERERLLHFIDTVVLPQQQLLVRPDDLARLPRNAEGEVDLAAVLADRQLRGALIEGRSYGQAIDQMLARRPAGSGLELLPVRGYSSGRLLPMLAMGRIDYTIEYTGVIAAMRARDPAMPALRVLPIQGASELLPIGIACPRTAWGLAASRGIDKVLGTPDAAARLRASIESLLPPDLSAAQRARIDAFFRQRAKPALVR